jgi:proteic killer suppression protein
MIKSFRCKETQKLYNGGKPRKFDSRITSRAIVKLDQLAAADVLDDLRVPPSNHLKALSHNRNGQYSIRINQQWRVCFEWENGAKNVEITDYH